MKTLAALATLLLVVLILGFLARRKEKRPGQVIRNTRHWGLK